MNEHATSRVNDIGMAVYMASAEYPFRIEGDVQGAVEAGERAGQVFALASRLHDDWRAPRLRSDGTYDPRVKVLAGLADGEEKWYNAGQTPDDSVELMVQDIANTPYGKLHEEWQSENLTAAETVIGILGSVGINLGTDDVEAVASQVHDAWLARPQNAWALGGELDVPYPNLPESEQAKDRSQVLAGIAILALGAAIR